MAQGKTKYFSHDSKARLDAKIINLRSRYGAEGYGVFFMILERLREEDNFMSVKDYNALAFDFRVDSALVKSVIEDFGLFAFTEDGKCFYSVSFMKRMKIKEQVSESRKTAAIARWKETHLVQPNKPEVVPAPPVTPATPMPQMPSAPKPVVQETKAVTVKPETSKPASVFNFKVNETAKTKLEQLFRGLPDILPTDLSESLRFCSCADKVVANKILNRIVVWRSKNKEHFYIELQKLQAMEQRGEISPPPREAWRAYEWVNSESGGTAQDKATVFSLINKEPSKLETLKQCIEFITNNKKSIKTSPIRYVLAALTKKEL